MNCVAWGPSQHLGALKRLRGSSPGLVGLCWQVSRTQIDCLAFSYMRWSRDLPGLRVEGCQHKQDVKRRVPWPIVANIVWAETSPRGLTRTALYILISLEPVGLRVVTMERWPCGSSAESHDLQPQARQPSRRLQV